MKEIYLDIGELGWSLYLSAHIRWLRQQGIWPHAVMTLPGRDCLYEGLVDKIFHAKWKHKEGIEPDCFGFYGLQDFKLRAFFNAKVPAGYQIAESQPLEQYSREEIFKGEMIFKPYPYKEYLGQMNLAPSDRRCEIIVFPRYRSAFPFSLKNLPKEFYVELINTLCKEFYDDYLITTVGTRNGAYDILEEEIEKDNYLNIIGLTPTIQSLIDRLEIARATVGSQSAPPKIALLQNVPTYMIGHTKKRHQEEENWGNAKCGFWETQNYNNFNDDGCIPAIVKFFKEVIK